MAGQHTPSSEELLDSAIECTFPASDPVAVEDAYLTARRREKRQRAAGRDPGAVLPASSDDPRRRG